MMWDVFDKIDKGVALGELTMISAGRSIGKSDLIFSILKFHQPLKRFTLLSSRVDDTGVTWHTAEVPVFEVLEWLEEQDPSHYSELIDSSRYFFRQFSIHEQLFTMMALRWS